MTIAFPDISSYEDGLRLQGGTVAVIAKATEGNYYKDADFFNFKEQAHNVGAVFSGYHFLKAGIDPAEQARYYHDFAGNIPCMLDVETEGTSKPGVDVVVAFIAALKALGGRVWGVYFPKWYWEQVGGDLNRLTAAGAILVSSSYTTYSDTGPGWEAYATGQPAPTVWQYTNAFSYGGQSVDFNAYKGTVQQLSDLINGDTMDPSTPLTFPAQVTGWYPDLAKDGGTWTGQQSFNDLITMMAGRVGHIVHVVETLQAEVAALKAGGTVTGAPTAQQNAAETLAELKARL